jgi:hypothetical protein
MRAMMCMLAGRAPRRPLEEEDDEPIIMDVTTRRVDPPLRKIPDYIEVYPNVRGFSAGVKAKLLLELQNFHCEVYPNVRRIVQNNRDFGIHVEETRFGDGLFNGPRRIPRKDIPFAFYISSISLDAQYQRDRDSTYGYCIDRTIFGYNCTLDAKFHVADKQQYSGGLLNHSCTPNCYGAAVTEPTTDVPYLVFYSDRAIEPGEQLFIDYNEGTKLLATGGYWEHTSNLTHVPEWALRLCGCNHPAICPKRRGYDLRKKRPWEANAILEEM